MKNSLRPGNRFRRALPYLLTVGPVLVSLVTGGDGVGYLMGFLFIAILLHPISQLFLGAIRQSPNLLQELLLVYICLGVVIAFMLWPVFWLMMQPGTRLSPTPYNRPAGNTATSEPRANSTESGVVEVRNAHVGP